LTADLISTQLMHSSRLILLSQIINQSSSIQSIPIKRQTTITSC